MIQFSNAQPIQFWRFDEQTFNEKEVCGINPACFCQPIEVADPITIQFTDDTGPDFYLVALDEDYGIIDSTIFDKVGTRYQLTGTPATLMGSSQAGKRQFLIRRSTGTVQTMAAPSTWTNVGTAFDSKTATQFIENAFAGTTRGARLACVVPTGGRVKVVYTVDIVGAFSGIVQVTPYLTTSAGGAVVTVLNDFQVQFTAPGSYVIEAIMEVTSVDSEFITMSLAQFGLSGAPNVTITIDPAALLFAPHELKSDCLDVKATHDCTNLATYSNAADYAGIDYDTSPAPEFNLRIPSVFFDEEFPEEQEVHPLSDDTFIQTWSRIEAKRRLDIGFCPYYFHQKLKLVLAHQFISIDGMDWVKRDSYEIDAGSKRWPLKKASVMLTDKNFIKRNLL